MKKELNIEDTYTFYKEKRDKHLTILQNLKKRIHQIGTLRLILIIGMLATLWICRNSGVPMLMAIAALFMLVFLILVVYHTKLHEKRTYEEGITNLCKNELKALDYDFSAFDGGAENIDAQHSFSLDLDLFGENSLFQSANRTVTQMGKETLLSWFMQPLDDKKNILMRQDGVREISSMTGFRHDFYVNGKAVSEKEKDIKPLFSTNDSNVKSISGNLFFRFLIWLVPSIWAILITGCTLDLISTSMLGIYFVVSLMLANIPVKHIQKQYSSVNKMEGILKTYSILMDSIEQEKFHSAILQEYQKNLTGESADGNLKHTSASHAIKKLSRNIGALDQRFSYMGVVLNLLYMRDTRQAIKLEQWQAKYSGKLKGWFDTLGAFDAFGSLGAFAFNHPGYIYPSIADSYFEMQGKALGHPLIHRDKCVCNNIDIPESKYFLIITGANMAGKSTYLRTIGVNFLFACIGLPTYAESLTIYPAHMVTSLRTADSLVSNESYFFAELKRLKMIIDRLNNGEKLFIILDEILKGTNSIDKQKGSIALIKQLVNKETCGIIATHDLLLGSLSEIFPNNVCNKRFEADIKNEELTFTYQIRDGIAQNMNATFLMRKMGIFEDE